MDYTLFIDRDVQVAAVDVNGKEHAQSRMQIRAGDRTVTVPDANVWFPVALERVKELRVQTRPMYRVRFEGLALEPVEELPEVGGETDIQVALVLCAEKESERRGSWAVSYRGRNFGSTPPQFESHPVFRLVW